MTTHALQHEPANDAVSKEVFGFWIYIMSDCILFATIFATYAVLYQNTFGAPGIGDLMSIPFVLTETLLLLTSSFTYGLAMLARYANNKNAVLMWLMLTFVLGFAFISMELYEFSHLVHEGHGWQRSASLSVFFTLVGTHGLHVTLGLVWMLVMMIHIAKYGIKPVTTTKLSCLGLFWHFLDIVWIFVFSIVYLMGAI